MSTNTDCRLAQTAAEIDAVHRLRYECYHRRGAIAANGAQRFSDAYDELPNHFSFLATQDGEPLGTVRISVVRAQAGWTASPGAAVFGDHETFRAIAGASYVEANRLCFREQARRDVLYRLVASMTALADFYETEWLVACPRVEHSPIYQRLFGFRPLAAPRQYFGVSFETELLGIRREEIRQVARGVKPMQRAWSDALAMVGTALGVAAAAA